MKRVLVAVTFLIQIVIVLSFFIKPVYELLDQWIEDYLYASVPAMVLILSIQVAIFMYFREQRLERYLSDMKKLLQTGAHIEYLSEEEFYSRFLYFIRNEAKAHVWITYLDTHPPIISKYQYKKQYYDQLTGLIQGSNVRFRRILRATKGNLAWVQQLIKDLSGHDNFSLACYMDPDTTSPSIPALSLQRIDDEHTFIVAMAEQEATTEQRDVYIKSAKFTSHAMKYYLRLWNRSTIIMERGKVNEGNLKDLEARLA